MATFRVSSEADVVEVVRAARDSRRTLEIVGHGTKRGFGRPVQCDDVLDLSGLSGIVSYESDEMIITARAATPVAEIEAALAEKNQRLGFEPADWGPLFGAPPNSATIGGVLSADANGSAAVRYGRCRDHLLGFRSVNGFGEAYKGGGKVVKNVTGFDLPKLFCGAMGTLGPLTEVTLRIFPKGSASEVFAVRADRRHGLALLRSIWMSPLEATGLACTAETAFIRLEGEAESLKEKIAMLRALVAPNLVLDDDGDFFRRISSGKMFEDSTPDVWRVVLPPSLAADCSRLDNRWVSDWAGGLHWLNATPGLAAEDLQCWLAHKDGRFTLVRASEATRRLGQIFPAEAPVRAELTRRVKAAFDPLRLFNPGRMWEGV